MKKTIWLVLFAAVVLACKPTVTKTPKTLSATSGGDRSAIIPPSWTVPAWFIDPANSTTCASDNNNCTQGTCGAGGSFQGPCVTYGEIAARWGMPPRMSPIPRAYDLTTTAPGQVEKLEERQGGVQKYANDKEREAKEAKEKSDAAVEKAERDKEKAIELLRGGSLFLRGLLAAAIPLAAAAVHFLH